MGHIKKYPLLVIRDHRALADHIVNCGYTLEQFATKVLDIDPKEFQDWLMASEMPWHYAKKIDNFFGLTGTKETLFKTEEELHPFFGLYCHGEDMEPVENDPVNRPSHYTSGAIEVIDYIRDKLSPEQFIGFCLGNVLKYVSRARLKNGIEDLQKAEVYLKWAIENAVKREDDSK